MMSKNFFYNVNLCVLVIVFWLPFLAGFRLINMYILELEEPQFLLIYSLSCSFVGERGGGREAKVEKDGVRLGSTHNT